MVADAAVYLDGGRPAGPDRRRGREFGDGGAGPGPRAVIGRAGAALMSYSAQVREDVGRAWETQEPMPGQQKHGPDGSRSP